MLHPDRWNERVPKAHQCTTAELADFLRVAERAPNSFTDWERAFCRSCRPHRLTPKQMHMLDRGLLRKLWNRDPDLWK